MGNSPPRPNIIVILCDQLRADALGFMGNGIVKTPNLDRLAREGTVFAQAFVTQPTCTPSRASLLSGCYPSTLRSRMVGCYTPDDPRFLPRVLRDRGYRTASIGKIHLVPQRAEPWAVARTQRRLGVFDYYGFQEVDLVNGHGDRCFGPQYTAWIRAKVPDLESRLSWRRCYAPGIRESYTYELPAEVHSSNYIGERVVSFLRNAASEHQPFFLHVSFPDPHPPFAVPEPYASMYCPAEMPPPIPPVTDSVDPPPLHLDVYFARNLRMKGQKGSRDRVIGTKPEHYDRYSTADWQQVKALYYGMITLVDENVGRILTTLRETGLSDSTTVVFTSDHGDYLGDHGMYGKGLPYDGALHVPLVFSGVGAMPGQRVEEVTSLLDVTPTILDIAGVEEPEGVQGVSLRQVLAGEEKTTRRAVLTENDDDFVPMRMRVLTTADWKLVIYAGEDFGELYDRRNDPAEIHNLWSNTDYAMQRAELYEMLMEEILCSLDVINGRRQSPAPIIAQKWIPRHNRLV